MSPRRAVVARRSLRLSLRPYRVCVDCHKKNAAPPESRYRKGVDTGRNMATYSTCIFCWRNDYKPSREDVLRQWVQKKVPAFSWQITDLEIRYRFASRKGLDGVISKAPCSRCSNVWMERLESKARPLLVPMIHGVHCKLNQSNQTSIAAWLLKTAMDFDLRTVPKIGVTYYTPEECHAMMSSNFIPSDTRMFLAEFRGTPPTFVNHAMGVEVDPTTLPPKCEGMMGLETYTATFVLKHLVLQVFSFRRPEMMMTEPLDFQIADWWTPPGVQIWPIQSSTISWPPPRCLDNETLNPFAARWQEFFLHIRGKYRIPVRSLTSILQ